jgi:hypothetical protein
MAPNAFLRAYQRRWRSASSAARWTSRAPPCAAQLGGVFGVRGDGGGAAVELDDQRGGDVGRQAGGVGAGLDGADRLLIHHLEGGGQEAGADDGADRAARVVDVVEEGEQRLHGLGQRQQPDVDLGGDAERPLAADEQPRQVQPGILAGAAAEPDDAAVGQHDGEAEDVVRRDAVLQAVRPAGVLATLPPMVHTVCELGSGA